MKKLFIPLVLLLLGGVSYWAYLPTLKLGATVCYPAQGCTGTSTKPTYGRVLLGNSSGLYDLVSTSSLGITSSSASADWVKEENYGIFVLTPSTTIPVWIKEDAAFYASSTSFFAQDATLIGGSNLILESVGSQVTFPNGGGFGGDVTGQIYFSAAQQMILDSNSLTTDRTYRFPDFSGIPAVINLGQLSSAYFTGTSTTQNSTFLARVGVGTTTPFATVSIRPATSTIPFAVSTTTLTLASSTLFMVDAGGWAHFGGGTPALSSCGTNPFLDGNSTDQAGTVTFGATASGCTITFAQPAPTTPHCVVVPRAISLVNAYTVDPTTASIVITQAASGGTVWDYFCPLGH